MIKSSALGVLIFAMLLQSASAQYASWRHSGSLYILTTPDGANLPSTAAAKDFPLLVRLNKDFFAFGQAQPHGEDIRFADGTAAPLAYEIDEWDAANATASIWVRVPEIKGNSRQEIKMYWGKPDAASESSGKKVFNESNGYLSVWHMHGPVTDVVGTLESKDTGTTSARGIIGEARHFPGKHGIFGGNKIPNYPSLASPHSTELWFKAADANATLIGWGNEGGNRGSKVRMVLRSPPHIHIDSDFCDVNGEGTLPMSQWTHVAHTYDGEEGHIYINGILDGLAKLDMLIRTPGKLWIGGWYDNYDFVGDIDEVRVSKVARSADWEKLQFENQKPLQTLVGPLVQPGNEFSVSQKTLAVQEGKRVTLSAKAGGAEKVYWILKRDGKYSVAAVDRFEFALDAGRVAKDENFTLQFKAVCADKIKTADISISVRKVIPDPAFTLQVPAAWNGRDTIEVVPEISNSKEMQAAGAAKLKYDWAVSGMAAIKEVKPGKLILKRSQNSGELSVALSLSNGGAACSQTSKIAVTEPKSDPWVVRTPEKNETPEDGQFYARDDKNEGTLYYHGTLPSPLSGKGKGEAGTGVRSAFLKVYADGRLVETKSQPLAADNAYAFTVKLKPGLIKYKVELGSKVGEVETVLKTVSNLVCGDAYLINGQSNGLATDTGEQSPPVTNEWIRSYGPPRAGSREKNLWCNPVWKSRDGKQVELGYWGMELAKRLVRDDKMPIFIINGAVGGTRIDQHQRNPADPEDPETIYGRLLSRVRQAKLTHGVRGILWHQGENNQGSASPTGDYDWKSYQDYFVEMSAGWKQDFPNVQHYYIFQIWPNACSMGGGRGSGDMLREVQRTLPRLYSNMDIMSTLGIKPAGGCHYPLAGWAEFARLMQPLIERDNYGKTPSGPISAPNLRGAYFTSDRQDAIALEFDQPVVWKESLASQFYLDGGEGKIASAAASGNILALKLKSPSRAKTISYLLERKWSENNLLLGRNGIAALTFYEVPIAQSQPTP